MSMNTNYIARSAECAARSLKHAGLWDVAPGPPVAETTALRAEILTDRFFWRLDQPAEAEVEQVNSLAARTARKLELTWLIQSL